MSTPQPYDPIHIPADNEPNSAEVTTRKRRRFATQPVRNRDLIPIVMAIRQIQQQVGITPLLRLRIFLGPDEGDDDS